MSVTIKGKLVPVLRNPGSKSEQRGFAVELPEKRKVVVENRGDLPFQSSSLDAYAHHQVRIVGVMYRGRLIADEIVRLDESVPLD